MKDKLKITIVDYSSSNLKVLIKKLNDFGYLAEFTNKPAEILEAEFLMIPGVGHFGASMKRLKDSLLIDALNEKVINQKTPIIGICLGMQLFTKYSEEGEVDGLGWIDARTEIFKFKNNTQKIPCIGWTKLNYENSASLFENNFKDHNFYFLHSYFVRCKNEEDVLTYNEYGGIKYCSSLKHENIIGFQFHPEKSHKKGMSMLIQAIEFLKDEYGK